MKKYKVCYLNYHVWRDIDVVVNEKTIDKHKDKCIYYKNDGHYIFRDYKGKKDIIYKFRFLEIKEK